MIEAVEGRWTAAARARVAQALAEVLRLTVTRPSRAGGRPIGLVTYTFTSEAQRDAFLAGDWPLTKEDAREHRQRRR